MTAPEIGPLHERMWPEAMRLCARAFCDYGYVHELFGDDPLDRFAGTMSEFGRVPWTPNRIAIGAWAGAGLVATASVERLGHCHVCHPDEADHDHLTEEDERLEAAARRFDDARRREHSSVADHGHLVLVAVEPVIQRAGVGHAVIEAAIGAFRDDGGGPLVLECIEPLGGYYERLGFTSFGGFGEPASDDIVVMRADV